MNWIKQHFEKRYILTPFGATSTAYNLNGGLIGYTDYFIFGLRVVRIQKTKPWETV